MNKRHEYFKRRLQEEGMYDIDSDYAGEIGKIFHTSHVTIQKIVRDERWKGY